MATSRTSGETRTFHALADPTRRRMLELLADRDHTATELAKPFRMSQPAASQHLRVLRDAGLVTVQPAGRLRRYRVNAVPLRHVYDWIKPFERFWDLKLEALALYLNRSSATKRNTRTQRKRRP